MADKYDRLGTGEVPGSNPGKGENFSVKINEKLPTEGHEEMKFLMFVYIFVMMLWGMLLV